MIRPLILFFFLSQAAWGVEIVFPNKGFTSEELVKFFWRSIPLNQLTIDPSTSTAYVKGKIDLSLHRLPGKTRDGLKTRVARILNGDELIAGLRVDASRAEITFTEEAQIRRDELAFLANVKPRSEVITKFAPGTFLSGDDFCERLLKP